MDLTYLFVPGISERKILKSFSSDADVIIIDLEDSVSVTQKDKARQIVYNVLKNKPQIENSIFIRINSNVTPWFNEDLRLISDLNVDGIMIPKCDNGSVISSTTKLISNKLEIIPLIESAAGVDNVRAIIQSSNQIKKVAFGAVDFAYDLGVEWSVSGEERKHAMQQLVLISKAIGAEPPIDGVYPVIDKKDDFLYDTKYGKEIGFYGKMTIHPKHIEWVKEVYRPTTEQIKWSKKVVSIYENGENTGAVELDGKLIDYPVYTQAMRTLAFLDKNVL